jgi:hypothetical protein
MTSISILRFKTPATDRVSLGVRWELPTNVTNFFAIQNFVCNSLAVRGLLCVLLIGCCCVSGLSQGKWRGATEKELAALIPARAPVEKEQIETELRTASGVTDGKGKFIAGVVIITAGYAAEGKYSHFFITQTPLRVGEITLPAGEYVFGFKRVDGEMLEVRFFEAATGNPLGMVNAQRQPARGPIQSLLISPPVGGKGTMQLGRFVFNYVLNKP